MKPREKKPGFFAGLFSVKSNPSSLSANETPARPAQGNLYAQLSAEPSGPNTYYCVMAYPSRIKPGPEYFQENLINAIKVPNPTTSDRLNEKGITVFKDIASVNKFLKGLQAQGWEHPAYSRVSGHDNNTCALVKFTVDPASVSSTPVNETRNDFGLTPKGDGSVNIVELHGPRERLSSFVTIESIHTGPGSKAAEANLGNMSSYYDRASQPAATWTPDRRM